jgi:hypothetical protein
MIHRPPEKEETVAIVTPKKKNSPEAAKSKAKKSEEGKARQAKARNDPRMGKSEV